MSSPAQSSFASPQELGPLDRVVVAYLTFPVAIFLLGWLEIWAALPLLACLIFATRSIFSAHAPQSNEFRVTYLQFAVAVLVGFSWTMAGGADHLLFANADWHVRDAVLHDLVVSRWPVGYGSLDGKESLLRAPVAFFLPAALVGKCFGLRAAHAAMGFWTAIGASLFLLQVLSLTESRISVALVVALIVVMFSGLDIVGNLLNDGPRFRRDWQITTHLEWWAGKYQYSSMTTQLFWVPNHALGGWLSIGLLCRNRRGYVIASFLPILIVSIALWSPLTALGLVPFFTWRAVAHSFVDGTPQLLHPRVWLPSLLIGCVVAAYLTLDPGRISKGIALGAVDENPIMEVLQQAQFFLLEAGFIGAAILAIRRSTQVAIALTVLALLPLAYLGPANDLVMRASIPSLTILTIGACLALVQPAASHGSRNRMILGALLVVGAMTPIAEFARAAALPAWPINMGTTLIGANCGGFPPHYVARVDRAGVGYLLRRPNPLAVGSLGPESCDNPALELMWGGKVL